MFLFVGESPSPTAKARRWTWASGRLAAKQLFDALEACGIDPRQQQYLNLFCGPSMRVCRKAVTKLRITPLPVVAMGGKVQAKLKELGIPFRPLVHPAARGRIRRKDRYTSHVRSVLKGA